MDFPVVAWTAWIGVSQRASDGVFLKPTPNDLAINLDFLPSGVRLEAPPVLSLVVDGASGNPVYVPSLKVDSVPASQRYWREV
jgi:hypothetical protein